MAVVTTTTIETSHQGAVSSTDLERAVDKVRGAADRAREPVHHIEVRLQLASNPAHERPAVAEATIDVNGSPVRAHVAAPTVPEAVDELIDRLRSRLDRFEDRLHQLHVRHRTGDSGPGEWHHGDLPAHRPPWVDLPYEEREVRRKKTFAMTPMTVEEAAFDLLQLDHSFYLFVDEATSDDAVIRREDDGSFSLQRARPEPGTPAPEAPALRRIETAAPVLSEAEAKEHVDASGDRFLFFVSARDGRGHVLYRRYDGHYGLIGPR